MADEPLHVIVDDPVGRGAAWLADALTAADAARGPAGARLAIPGGSALAVAVAARALLDDTVWARLTLTWVDERRVPHADPESNLGAATRAGLFARGAPRRVIPLYEDGESVRDALVRVEAALAGDAGDLDVLLLGIGADGHIASLFPDRPEPTAGLVAFVEDAPKPPPERFTLTRRALARAPRALVVATGAAKRDAVARALARDPALAISALAHLTLVTDPPAGGPP